MIPNMRPFSETLFEQLCSSRGIPCERIATEAMRTADFAIGLRSIRVICEVKQIDPNVEDLQEMQNVSSAQATGRFVPESAPSEAEERLRSVKGGYSRGFSDDACGVRQHAIQNVHRSSRCCPSDVQVLAVLTVSKRKRCTSGRL